MQNYQPQLISMPSAKAFHPIDSLAAIAIYTNGQPKPMLQVHLCGEPLKAMGSPDLVMIESGHDSDREWLFVSPADDTMRNARKITSNETATLPQYVRLPAAALEVVPIEKTLTYCSGEIVYGTGVRIYLPRGFRLSNDNDKPVTDGEFIANLKGVMREASARGITIEASDNGGLQVRRTTIERL